MSILKEMYKPIGYIQRDQQRLIPHTQDYVLSIYFTFSHCGSFSDWCPSCGAGEAALSLSGVLVSEGWSRGEGDIRLS